MTDEYTIVKKKSGHLIKMKKDCIVATNNQERNPTNSDIVDKLNSLELKINTLNEVK